MSDEKESKAAEVQNPSEPAAATPSPAADSKITLSLDELKGFMKATVEDVLKNAKLDETRKLAEEYNNQIADSVQNSQASLIKPNIADGQKHIDYIKGVLDEDNRRRFQDSEGKALYSDKGEDFIKAKIVLLKKIGLSEEEIAQNLKDVL